MIKLLLRFFSILPLRLNHLLGALIGRLLFVTRSESRRVSEKNITLCFPELNAEQQQGLVRKSLIEAGKSLTESSYIWYHSFRENQRDVVSTQGMELLESDKPTILLVPHFGCWEITGRVISLTKPVTFLYKPLRSSTQERLLFSKRQQGDLSMASADKKGVIKLQRALSKQQALGILPDQFPGVDSGVIAPFFSQDAYTMTLLAKLARKNDAQVLLTWAKRLDKGRGFELNLKPVNILSDSAELVDDLTLMNKAIEELVRSCPQQYMWNYKRFKYIVDY